MHLTWARLACSWARLTWPHEVTTGVSATHDFEFAPRRSHGEANQRNGALVDNDGAFVVTYSFSKLPQSETELPHLNILHGTYSSI